MSDLERCPSCTESSKGNKERQGPFLGVRFIEMSVKGEATVQFFFCSIFVKTLDETTKAPFTRQNIFDAAWMKVVRVPKK